MAKINDLPLLSNPTEDMYCLVGKEDLHKVPWSAIMGQIGAPYIATTVAGMTDKTRVYVYQGSESGYTSGNWYYWNGSAWTSGGTYNSTAVDTDKTLTQSDKPADSAVVGKEIGSLKESLEQLYSYDGICILDIRTVQNGKIWSRDGQYKTLLMIDNQNWFSFPPIRVKKGEKIFTSNIGGSHCFILYGSYNDDTGAYDGIWNEDIFSIQHYTGHDSDVEYREYEFVAEKDGLLFICANTLQDYASVETSYICKGTKRPTAIPTYKEMYGVIIPHIIHNTLIVSKDGKNGAFTTIQSACDNANDGDTILVLNGEYKESVTCIDKEINIVGISKEKCVLWYDSDQYVGGMPLSIAYGSVQNMTIKCVRATETTSSRALPYAVHIDYDICKDKTLKFDNVDMIGGWQASCGIGLKSGFNLSFKNCNFISDMDTTNGTLFFHDNNISGYNGTSNIEFDTCNIINKNGTIAIMPKSFGSTENRTNMRFVRNCIYSSLGGKTNDCVGVGRPVTGDGWRMYNNFFLDKDSFGNNVALFNA